MWLLTLRNRFSGQYIGLVGAYKLAIGLIIVLFSVTILVLLQQNYSNQLEHARNDAEKLSLVFEEQVNSTLVAIDRLSVMVGRDYLKLRDDPNELLRSLRNLLRLDELVFQLSVIDSSGKLVISSIGPDRRGLDLSDREHFQYHLNPQSAPFFISRPVLGRISGKVALQYTRKIFDENHQLQGVAVVSFNPEYLSHLYNRLSIGTKGSISLVGLDGYIRVSSAVDGINEELSQQFEFSEEIKQSIEGGFNRQSAIDGVKRTYSFRRMRTFPLVVVIGLAYVDIFEDFSSTVLGYLLTLSWLVVAMLVIYKLLIKQFFNHNRQQLLALELQRNRLLETVFEHTEALVVVADKQGCLKLSNPALNKILLDQDVSGDSFWDYLTGLSFSSLKNALPLVVEHTIEKNLYNKITIAWTLTEFNTQDERDIIGVGFDLTQQRESQTMLYQSAKLATLGEMVTGMAHEINQPLNIIKLCAHNVLQLCQMEEIKIDTIKKKSEKILNNIERVSKIINHMRAFGRRDEEKLNDTELMPCIEGALIITENHLKCHDIAVVISNYCQGEVFVHADPMRLEQVLINLLSNAKDAILSNRQKNLLLNKAPQTDSISIQLHQHDNSHILLKVIDTGGGIPEAILDKVFEPFFTTKPVGKGTGLGLSVSFSIIQGFGGVLSVSNQPYGACFTLKLIGFCRTV